jgi:predicted cupin superfamily sugar epimerase
MMKDQLIACLGLEPHDEGGYFRQMYQSHTQISLSEREGVVRPLLNTIYYLLTRDNPVGHFHSNASDIVHFFHAGSPLTYLIISPKGELTKRVLGPDVVNGHELQLTVPGGAWKATVLLEGDFGLVSEAVAPGFDYRDRRIATKEELQTRFSAVWNQVAPYVLHREGES